MGPQFIIVAKVRSVRESINASTTIALAMTPSSLRTIRARTAGDISGDTDGGCRIGDLFHLLGKTYVLDILNVFTRDAGPRRFVELQAQLSMSPNTLSDRLKSLVEAGLLSRTAFNETPPRVDYEATEKAYDLKPVFESLREWADRHTLRPEHAPPKAPLAVTP